MLRLSLSLLTQRQTGLPPEGYQFLHWSDGLTARWSDNQKILVLKP